MSTQNQIVITKYRELSDLPKRLVTLLTLSGIVVSIVYIFGIQLFGKVMVVYGYLTLLQALFMPIVFLLLPAHRRFRDFLPWYDIFLACLGFGIPFFYFINAWEISITEGWEVDAPKWAYITALIYGAMILEAVRRAQGWFLFLFLLLIALYPLISQFAPGIFESAKYDLYKLTVFHMFGPDGVSGLIWGVVGNLFIGFLIFGSVMAVSGAATSFTDLTMSTLGKVRGGAAKAAVGSGSLVGIVSGSTIANVLIMGPVTIPGMKNTGYPAHYAGGIVSCAATGGVLMPPVMGAVAFVMAGLLNVRYVEICVAAVIPALLYYLSLFIQVDSYAGKHKLRGLPANQVPPLKQSVLRFLPYMVAVVILVWLLIYLRREAEAPFYAAVYLIFVAMLRKETRFGVEGFVKIILTMARIMVEITPICLGIGFILGTLSITGTALILGSAIAELAGGNVYLLLGLAGMACFIIGMGLDVISLYLIASAVLAQPLIKMGLDPMSVHLFLLYCGNLSYITPPVCISVYPAAALSGASVLKTGFTAVRLGVIIFVIPFLFVLNPAFILHGSVMEIIHVVITGFIGVALLASGLERYLIGIGELNRLSAGIVFISGVMLFLPFAAFEMAGGILGALTIVFMIFRNAKSRRAQVGC